MSLTSLQLFWMSSKFSLPENMDIAIAEVQCCVGNTFRVSKSINRPPGGLFSLENPKRVHVSAMLNGFNFRPSTETRMIILYSEKSISGNSAFTAAKKSPRTWRGSLNATRFWSEINSIFKTSLIYLFKEQELLLPFSGPMPNFSSCWLWYCLHCLGVIRARSKPIKCRNSGCFGAGVLLHRLAMVNIVSRNLALTFRGSSNGMFWSALTKMLCPSLVVLNHSTILSPKFTVGTMRCKK